MKVTRAITIRPPWSLAVAAGVKKVENRGRPTSYRGPIAIHSGATWSREGAADPRIIAWWLGPDPVERVAVLGARDFAYGFGRVLAVAELIGCHRAAGWCCGEWGDRLYLGKPAWHLEIAGARRLDDPVVATGRLALPWTLPDDLAAQVSAQVGSAS